MSSACGGHLSRPQCVKAKVEWSPSHHWDQHQGNPHAEGPQRTCECRVLEDLSFSHSCERNNYNTTCDNVANQRLGKLLHPHPFLPPQLNTVSTCGALQHPLLIDGESPRDHPQRCQHWQLHASQQYGNVCWICHRDGIILHCLIAQQTRLHIPPWQEKQAALPVAVACPAPRNSHFHHSKKQCSWLIEAERRIYASVK